jgi:hypothetical protein
MTLRIGVFILLFSCLCAAQTAKRITGKYSNPAFGYEVTVPEGLVGAPDTEAGTEKGFTLTLPSGGTISVSGEPNTLGWKAPIDGIRHSLGVEKCDSNRQQATGFMRMGRLTATKATFVCGDRFVETSLTFHPGSAPIYWITLRTTAQKRAEDEGAFYKLAASFQLIPRQ